MKNILLLLITIMLLGCDETTTPATPATPVATVATVQAADTIYLNGEIITMQGDEPHYIDALAGKKRTNR